MTRIPRIAFSFKNSASDILKDRIKQLYLVVRTGILLQINVTAKLLLLLNASAATYCRCLSVDFGIWSH